MSLIFAHGFSILTIFVQGVGPYVTPGPRHLINLMPAACGEDLQDHRIRNSRICTTIVKTKFQAILPPATYRTRFI
jgi:hypothetical protein